MSFNENTPLKKVAFRYSGVYIFYEDEIPFAESDIYILKKDLPDNLVDYAIYRSIIYNEPKYEFNDLAKFIPAGVRYKYYTTCENYQDRYSLFYTEYPCCWTLLAGEIVYLDTPLGKNKFKHSLVSMVSDELGCQSQLDKHTIYAKYQLIKAVYKNVWIYSYPYMGVYGKGSYIYHKDQIYYVKDCDCDIDTTCDEHEDCFIPVGKLDCCAGMVMQISATYSKFEYETYTYTPVNEKRLFNLDIVTLHTVTKLGCEVDLDFYNQRAVVLGDSVVSPIEHLNEDYTYTYYITKHKFEITNSNNVVILKKDNVNSLSDLGIDIDIWGSCNFHIVYETTSEKGAFPYADEIRIIRKADEAVLFDVGLNNMYLPDRVRPYDVHDKDNPIRLFAQLAGLWYNKNISGTGLLVQTPMIGSDEEGSVIVSAFVLSQLTGISKYPYNWSNIVPNNYSYLGYDLFHMGYRIDTSLKPTIVDSKILLPEWSISAYPALMQIINKDETIINRPVYEPWMLWLLRFLYIKSTVDIKDDPLRFPVFDLSPNYGR